LAEDAGWDGVFVWDSMGGAEYDGLYADDPGRRAPWDPWALRYEGLIPSVNVDGGWVQPSPASLRLVVDDVVPLAASPFDIVVEGNSSRNGDKAARVIAPYAEAGATWWLDGVWSFLFDREHRLRRMRERIEAGPPRA
jgi:hypothetical protein